MNTYGISVVIPNFNGTALLPEILPALYLALQKSQLPYDIIVSDDCSTDDSIAYLQNNWSEVKIIENKKNRGFAPTINEGIRIAVYPWVLLLNSDVKLEEEYFNCLKRYMYDENCFGVMGRIIGWEDDNIQDGGKYPSVQAFKIKTNRNYLPLSDETSGNWYSMYLSGANALVNREKLLQLKGFDELFAPFYVEDFELSLRAWRMGWSCYYEHQAVCRHRISVTIKSSRKKQFIKTIYNRNKFFLHAIHLQGIFCFLWYMQLAMELIFRLLTGQIFFFYSVIDFILKIDEVNNSRKRLSELAASQKHKLLSVSQVMSKIHNSLEKKEIRFF